MIVKTKFKDLLVFKNKSFKDKRGYFKELIKENQLKKKMPFTVMSYSKKNVIRGLHIQTKKSQGKFISKLLEGLQIFHVKLTFFTLSRYIDIHEKSFSRWYRGTFNFSKFNCYLIGQAIPRAHKLIACIDASFMSKSGSKTKRLGNLYHSKIGKSKKELEISLISVSDVNAKTAYAPNAAQTVDE